MITQLQIPPAPESDEYDRVAMSEAGVKLIRVAPREGTERER